MSDNNVAVSTDPRDHRPDNHREKRGSSNSGSTGNSQTPEVRSSSVSHNSRPKPKSIGNYVLGKFILFHLPDSVLQGRRLVKELLGK